MKILHVITGLENGGAEGTLYRLATFSNHFDHHVISLTGEGCYAEQLRNKGIKVEVLGMKGLRSVPKNIYLLAKKIQQIKPDVIQTWMYHSDFMGSLAARLAGSTKIVWGIRHATLKKTEAKISTRLIAFVCAKMSYCIPKQIITCSEYAANWHVNAGYNRRIMNVVANGCDTKRFVPSSNSERKHPLRSRFNIGSTEFVVGMLARWHPDKDHQTLIQAIKNLQAAGTYKVHFLLAGPGLDENNRILISDLKKNQLNKYVHLCGVQSDVPNFMTEIDVHVLSSRTEAFPNVVVEAMACGTPCIATDVGDVSLIMGQTGWLIKSKDSFALADAIRAALNEKFLLKDQKIQWHNRRVAARQRIKEKFSIETMVSRYEKIWRQSCMKGIRNSAA